MFYLLSLVAFGYAIYFMDKVKHTTKKDAPLKKNEKIIVLITEILSPILSGAAYYYGWKKTFPQKAKQANNYSLIIFLIMLLLGFFFIFLNPQTR